MQGKKISGRYWIVKEEIVLISIAMIFNFFAMILTTYGIGIGGIIELNPFTSIFILNNLGIISFTIAWTLIFLGFIGIKMFFLRTFKYPLPRHYIFLYAGILLGSCIMDFYVDFLNIMYLSI